MPETNLIEVLPSRLHSIAEKTLTANEKVHVQIRGAFKEALICTDKRVIIVKAGFMTGNTFGSDIFQLPYTNVASAEVKMHLLTGYFEVSAGGMQNTRKSYWSQNAHMSSSQSPNCVSLRRAEVGKFREACTFITNQVSRVKSGFNSNSDADLSAALDRLWNLKAQGAIDQAEFEAAKRRLLESQ